MSEEPAMLPAALDDEATGMAPAAPPALARLQGSTEAGGDEAGAAAEAAPTQEEPGRLPAQERRTWFFRGMIALLGVLIAGLLAGGVVELRRGGVSVLATAIVIGFCAILGGGRLWLMALGYGWKEERGLKPGTPIPAKAKKSRWWRIALVYWAIFNVLATIAAITYAVSGDWANFSDFGMGALLSWTGFAIAASGRVPSRDFRF
jgi:hypothetical protein